MKMEPENSDNPIERLQQLIERRQREDKEKQLQFYLSNLGVKLTSFPAIFLN